MTLDCTNIELAKGSNGSKVKEVQTILKNLGFYDGLLDGDYGTITVNAVKLFQRSKGLAQDGWVGPVTCKALNTAGANNTTISNYRDFTGKKFLKDDITKAATTYRTHIKNNKNYPNYIIIKDSTGTSYNLARANYMGLFEGVSQFFVKNGREPNYVVLNSTANNPLAIDYQNNSIQCGPASTSMCMQMLGKWIPENTLATAMNTNKASQGTAPSNLVAGVKKFGFEYKEINRNITAVQKALSEGSPVLMHIHSAYSGGRSCLGYRGSFGHYIMCYGTNGNYYYIADPTKGFKTCVSTSIDNAKSSSNMKYYRLNPV